MSCLVIRVGLDQAVGRLAQSELEDALVDAAELLDRKIAIIDVFRAADPVVAHEVAEPEDDLRHDVVRELNAAEDRRNGGIEKAAVVRRDAEVVVSTRDGAKNGGKTRPERRNASRERSAALQPRRNVEAQSRQAIGRVGSRLVGQKVAILRVEHEQQAIEQNEGALPHLIEVGGWEVDRPARVRLGQRIGKRREDLVDTVADRVLATFASQNLPSRKAKV